MKFILLMAVFLLGFNTQAAEDNGWLVKLKNNRSLENFTGEMQRSGVTVKDLKLGHWVKLDITRAEAERLSGHPDILAVEENKTFKIQTNIEVHDPALRKQVGEYLDSQRALGLHENRVDDNPDIPLAIIGGSGADPLFKKQWGMIDNKVSEAWKTAGTKGSDQVIVAVIDTGVDYTHEDLVDNMWRNPGEMGFDEEGNNRATNGVDDDNNGFVDDVVGWDFGRDDSKPYDLYKTGMGLLLGGNPGHGTHCAGNIAATGDNGKGISGLAPNVKIMALRFLTEEGSGTTEAAIGAIKYAVDNGAQILSNSWGSEGEGEDKQASLALQDAIQYSMDHGVLFVAAAGNGHQGVGYNNDTDARPAFPASYPHDNIVSVAAIDKSDRLGSFSNWGKDTVDIGAPGVAVFSTEPDHAYDDTVINVLGLIKATWDGTSMAAPHVSGAAALYLSRNPNADWREIKQALLESATPISSLKDKSVANGKLNVEKLMQ